MDEILWVKFEYYKAVRFHFHLLFLQLRMSTKWQIGEIAFYFYMVIFGFDHFDLAIYLYNLIATNYLPPESPLHTLTILSLSPFCPGAAQ
jgi:hypothetical protein